MAEILKQNYVDENIVLCFTCKNYAVLCFAPGMPELQSCKKFGDIPEEMLNGSKCEFFCPSTEAED